MALTVTVSPARVGVGDRFTLTVDAAVPHGAGAVQLLASPGAFEQAAPPHITHAGDHVRLVETLVCVDRGCAPDAAPRRVVLPAPHATIGGTTVAGAAPVVTVVPRVPAAAVSASRAQFLQPTTIPASTAPLGLAAAAAISVAVILTAAAVWLAAAARRRAAPAVAAPIGADGLPLALRLLRESARRAVPDRRRAADLVSRLAPTESAEAATRLAWAPPEPEPPEVERLADQVERGAG